MVSQLAIVSIVLLTGVCAVPYRQYPYPNQYPYPQQYPHQYPQQQHHHHQPQQTAYGGQPRPQPNYPANYQGGSGYSGYNQKPVYNGNQAPYKPNGGNGGNGYQNNGGQGGYQPYTQAPYDC
ncbi:unnamed protein product [Bursaphelenchus okinawaensis]|uniref:Uncharacterized protein n=1 Tax=Bursaphelenchus okinawaensis TaxID=465554 RepID=A0A811KSU9_9BILA|nr:unnamed protein product [Bursaphelenchus okinawaensis]CAG9110355.1 unnamed protein product [Bursaphelenchus okinawaensis]